jgi:hypothetical protein
MGGFDRVGAALREREVMSRAGESGIACDRDTRLARLLARSRLVDDLSTVRRHRGLVELEEDDEHLLRQRDSRPGWRRWCGE